VDPQADEERYDVSSLTVDESRLDANVLAETKKRMAGYVYALKQQWHPNIDYRHVI